MRDVRAANLESISIEKKQPVKRVNGRMLRVVEVIEVRVVKEVEGVEEVRGMIEAEVPEEEIKAVVVSGAKREIEVREVEEVIGARKETEVREVKKVTEEKEVTGIGLQAGPNQPGKVLGVTAREMMNLKKGEVRGVRVEAAGQIKAKKIGGMISADRNHPVSIHKR